MSAGSAFQKSRVLLVDDHPIVRQGLTQLINAEQDLHRRQPKPPAPAKRWRPLDDVALPDIVIVDISLEDRNGVELIKDIVARHPESCHASRCRCTTKPCTACASCAPVAGAMS